MAELPGIIPKCSMLFVLFKLQSNQFPLADSGIVILKDTIPVRKPIHDEKVITQNHHVSS